MEAGKDASFSFSTGSNQFIVIFAMKPNLLVPVDFSEGSRILVSHAAELAKQFGAVVHLLYVSEPVAAYVPVGASMDVIAPPPVSFEPESLAHDLERLEELAGSIRGEGVEVETKAVPGLAVEEILDQAELLGAKFIVLASHGHGALYHLFSGSVVTGVLKQAVQPVVVVPVRSAG
jgi:nucleotide-binding universal stress UspA family protein